VKNRVTLIRLVLALLMPLALVLAVETVARLSLADAVRWMATPEAANPLRYTYLLLMFAALSLYAATNRLRGTCVFLFFPVSLLAILQAGKDVLLQQPLVPGDFLFLPMIAAIGSAAYFPFTWPQVGAFCVFTACWLAACRWGLPDHRLGRWRRVIIGAIACSLFCALFAQPRLFAARTVPVERKLTVVWRAEDNATGWTSPDPAVQNPDFGASFNYRGFGLIAGMLLHLDGRSLNAGRIPEDYSEASVRQAWLNLLPDAPETPAPPPAADAPHVVVVLSESFWDPTWLEGVRIEPDPLPHFRALAAASNVCALTTLSPIFGGYTCKAEFELLTGVAMRMLPESLVPHTGRYTSHIPSLPRAFAEQGYTTVAIHPFLPDFWNRNVVYPLMGFDRFLHIGTMRHRAVRGKFIGDDAVAEEILEVLAETKEGPAFVFAVTMQNHSPYGDGRYGEVEAETVRVETNALHAGAVRDYVHGIRDADAMLGKLTRRLAGFERPVVLLFVGDHQPNLRPLGALLGEYNQSLLNERLFPGLERKGKYMGPGLLWVSRGCAPKTPLTPLSLAALPAWLLRETGVPPPPFFQAADRVFNRYPALHGGQLITATGAFEELENPFSDPMLRDYHLICHDLVIGRNYSRLMPGHPSADRRR